MFMIKVRNFLTAVLLVLIFCACGECRERIALVIGNADYKESPLRNPVNDAEDVARALKKVGFDVTLLTNATQEQMESAITRFGDKLHKNSTGLFYFAGHGIEYNGTNYLLPVRANISAPGHLRYKTVAAQYVLSEMEESGSGLNLFFLDACRSNPGRSFTRNRGGGLAQMGGAEGTLIAYATSPNKTASDGDGSGRNSPYTKHLVRLIKSSNKPIELMLKDIRASVKKETNGAQTPWYNASIEGSFRFNRTDLSSQQAATNNPPPPPPPSVISTPSPAVVSGKIIPPPLEDLGKAYKVRLVYFVPTDKEVKPNYRQKAEVLMRVVADIYRREMKANGQKTRGLDFEFDEDGKLIVHLVKGTHPSVFYTGEPFNVDRLLNSQQQENLGKDGLFAQPADALFLGSGGGCRSDAHSAYLLGFCLRFGRYFSRRGHCQYD